MGEAVRGADFFGKFPFFAEKLQKSGFEPATLSEVGSFMPLDHNILEYLLNAPFASNWGCASAGGAENGRFSAGSGEFATILHHYGDSLPLDDGWRRSALVWAIIPGLNKLHRVRIEPVTMNWGLGLFTTRLDRYG